MRASILAFPLIIAGCFRPSPAANPDFSDAVRYSFVHFDAEEVDLAFGLRSLERVLYTSMDLEEGSVHERSVEVERLTEEDVAGIEHPDVDPGLALPVGLGGVSDYDLEEHKHIQMLEDQTPVEPSSPDQYDRTFLDGEDCWLERECDWMVTTNQITKKNALMEVPYVLLKDFRWVDLALPDPADVPEGEEPVNEGDPRWAYVARSWTTESAMGTGGDSEIIQSFTIDVWLPRDGRGYLRESTDENIDDGEWTADSSGGGAVHMLALWVHTEFHGLDFTDDQVAGLTRTGIDDVFEAADDWIEENSPL